YARQGDGLPARPVLEADDVPDDGDRRPGLEVAEPDLAAPPPVSQHHGQYVVLDVGPIFRGKVINHLSPAHFVQAVESDDPPPRLVDKEDGTIDRRQADELTAVFYQGHELLVQRLDLLPPHEQPYLAADGGHHLQQVFVRLSDLVAEEL